jgi:hypothetical protein
VVVVLVIVLAVPVVQVVPVVVLHLVQAQLLLVELGIPLINLLVVATAHPL